MDNPLDVLVVGAGQSGLALGRHLARRGQRFLLVDGAAELGHAWRSRWDSLRLFTPAQYDALPDLPFPAPVDTYPTKDEVADYLAGYAASFDLPVRLGCPVTRLEREGELDFVAHTPGGPLRARQVVIATGPFQVPHVPAIARDLPAEVVGVHTAHYRNPDQLPAGPAVVVGAGNSGLQIAEELASSREVTLAVGSAPPRLPQRLLGKDLFWWLTRTGAVAAGPDTALARRVRGDIVIGSSYRRLRRAGVTVRPRLVGASRAGVQFADGSVARPAALVWATGFRTDHSWLDVPGAVVDGHLAHHGGVTDVPGLYVLGQPWQRTRGSALLGFVGEDARLLAETVAARAQLGRTSPVS